jgi:hypothetical protein
MWGRVNGGGKGEILGVGKGRRARGRKSGTGLRVGKKGMTMDEEKEEWLRVGKMWRVMVGKSGMAKSGKRWDG